MLSDQSNLRACANFLHNSANEFEFLPGAIGAHRQFSWAQQRGQSGFEELTSDQVYELGHKRGEVGGNFADKNFGDWQKPRNTKNKH